MLHDLNLFLGKPARPLLFDVGANVGQTIDAFLQMFPEARIVAFEPSPKSFEALSRTHRSKAERIENLALGACRAHLPFHVMNKHSVNDSLLSMTSSDQSTLVTVDVRTLDEYCQANSIDFIDLLKVDTQGYDAHVIEGARRMLSERRIKAYCVELIFESMYVGQASYIDLLAAGQEFGYRLLGLYEQTYMNNRLNYCNACFVAT